MQILITHQWDKQKWNGAIPYWCISVWRGRPICIDYTVRSNTGELLEKWFLIYLLQRVHNPGSKATDGNYFSDLWSIVFYTLVLVLGFLPEPSWFVFLEWELSCSYILWNRLLFLHSFVGEFIKGFVLRPYWWHRTKWRFGLLLNFVFVVFLFLISFVCV